MIIFTQTTRCTDYEMLLPKSWGFSCKQGKIPVRRSMELFSYNEVLRIANKPSIVKPSSFEEGQVYIFDDQVQNEKNNDEQEVIQSNLDLLEQTSPYVTSYVCLLAPRFEEHLLTGDLSEELHLWMKDICISFGWQLKFIDVKPNYLHWIMSVSISSYPTQFMKIVCQESSQRIFDDFPRFEKKNMSREFWAPWYFVGVGHAPYSQNSINSFIKQIRMEQGLF